MAEKEKNIPKKVVATTDASVTPYVNDTKVCATKENPYHETGYEYKVPKHVADHLVKKGFATIVAMVLMALMFGTSNAQTMPYKMKASLTSTVDSVVCISTTPNYLYTTAVNGNYKAGSFQAVATRSSAAMGGTVFLQGSNDGSNWHTASVSAGDTITVSNAATSSGVILLPQTSTGFMYAKYRLKITGASGDTMTVKAWFNGRQ